MDFTKFYDVVVAGSKRKETARSLGDRGEANRQNAHLANESVLWQRISGIYQLIHITISPHAFENVIARSNPLLDVTASLNGRIGPIRCHLIVLEAMSESVGVSWSSLGYLWKIPLFSGFRGRNVWFTRLTASRSGMKKLKTIEELNEETREMFG